MTEAAETGAGARWEQLIELDALGALSLEGQRELAELARTDPGRSAELAVLRAMAELEPQAERLPEDDSLIEEALAAYSQRKRRRKVVAWPLAAVVLTPLAAAAAAAYLTVTGGSPTEVTGAPNTEGAKRQLSRELAAVAQAPTAEEAVTSVSSTPAPRPAPKQTSKSASAAELLAQAQRARAAKKYGRATRLYRQLIKQYSSRPEAGLARLSVAQLQLAQGQPGAALAGFRAYQRAGGALSQEAHYGKIQALRALGRSAEEREAIRGFIARYPGSLHVPALKRRLGE